MAIKTRAQLITELAATIFANTSNLIDATAHAAFLANILDTAVGKTSDNTLLGLFPYDPTRTYILGQSCTYLSGTTEIYVCNKATTTGAFVAADWDKKTTGGGVVPWRSDTDSLVAATPKAIAYSTTLGTTNYSLTINCIDASGDPVDVRITAIAATGFTAESAANCTIHYQALLDQ